MEWFEKALAIKERFLGEENPITATTYHGIGTLYFLKGDFPEAMKWFEKALAIREKVLGKEHHFTASTYSGIARVYFDQGDYPKHWSGLRKVTECYGND